MREAQSMVAAVPALSQVSPGRRRAPQTPRGADRGAQSRTSPLHAAISDASARWLGL
jgi:hypothetical protein